MFCEAKPQLGFITAATQCAKDCGSHNLACEYRHARLRGSQLLAYAVVYLKIILIWVRQTIHSFCDIDRLLDHLQQACQTGGPIACLIRAAGIFSVTYMIKNS
jgi:hypothetical protein